jgi:glucokinase
MGVEIGGTTMRAAIATSPRRIIARRAIPSPASLPADGIVQAAVGLVNELEAEAGAAPRAVGVSFAGPLDPKSGVILDSPHLRQTRGAPLRKMMEYALGVPVAMDNCENVAALGEHRLGAGRGLRSMLYVAVGTGIGAGIIHSGRLYQGARGAAGEVGHIVYDPKGSQCDCGRRGCWETLVSGPAIAREARVRLKADNSSILYNLCAGKQENVTSELVHQAALQNDRLASEILARAARWLGIGLANLVTVFDPERVVVGGGVAQIGNTILEPAFATARDYLYPFHRDSVRFLPAALGVDSGVVGALMLATKWR